MSGATANPSYTEGWEIAEPEFYALVGGTHYDPGNGYAILALTDASRPSTSLPSSQPVRQPGDGWRSTCQADTAIAYAPNSNGQPVAEWKY